MTYAADHAGALADIREAGTAVTFTRRTGSTHNPATGRFDATANTSTVSGYAIRTRGPSPDDMARYTAGGAMLREALVLLFAASTFGETPEPDATVVWGGNTYTVRDVRPVAPDGTAIVSKVTVTR